MRTENALTADKPFRTDLSRLDRRIRMTYILLNVLMVLLASQQNLDSPNLTRIGRHFGLPDRLIDERVGGEAYMGQMLVSSAALLLFGYLADRANRKVLLLLSVAAAGFSYLAAPLAADIDQFILLRSLAGVGIGGAVPVMFSLLGDLFTPRSRALASGLFLAVINIGMGLGFLIGGILGAEGALGWQASFQLQGLVLLACGLVTAACGKFPGRGEADIPAADGGKTYAGRIMFSDLKTILSNRTNLIFILTCFISPIPMGYLMRFLTDYFIVETGLTPAVSTMLLLLVLAGCIPGDFLGGIAGDWLHKRNRAWPSLFSVLAVLAGCGLFYLFFALPLPSDPGWGSLLLPVAVSFAASILVEAPGPVSKAIMLNVNVPENRGTIAALIQMTAQIGFGLGALLPSFVGLLGLPHSRLFNFRLAVLLWIPIGLSWLLVMRTAPCDEERMEREMRERAGKA